MFKKLNKRFSIYLLLISTIFSFNSNVLAYSIADDGVLSESQNELSLVAFNKVTPANGATVDVPENSYYFLTWTDALAPSSDRYQYCIDKTDNDKCDANNWVSRASLYSGGPGDIQLEYNKTYYWQVRLRDGGISADAGDWWSFTTSAYVGPAFSKTSPANGSTINKPQSTYHLLQWSDLFISDTDRYLYCIDTSNNNNCDSSWISRVNLFSGPDEFTLNYGKTYYWQVKTQDDGHVANNGTWFSFTISNVIPSFNKTSPANGATYNNPPSTYHLLQWSDLFIPATDRYMYCVDTSNNNTCNSTWYERPNLYSGTGEFTIEYGKTYYWQVKARDNGTAANGGTWYSFSVDPFYPSPYVVSIKRASADNPGDNVSVDFTVTFSQSVSGVDADDFVLTTTGAINGTSITNISGSGKTWTVTVDSGTDTGTIRLDLIDNDTIKNSQSSYLGGVGANNGSYTSGQFYTR